MLELMDNNPSCYCEDLARELGEMHTQFSDQYSTACVVAYPENTADQIIAHCRKVDAIYFEDGPDDECFVVALRHEIGPEIWTEQALRGSVWDGKS